MFANDYDDAMARNDAEAKRRAAYLICSGEATPEDAMRLAREQLEDERRKARERQMRARCQP